MREQVTVDEFRSFIQSLHRDEQRFWFAWSGIGDSWEPALDVLFEITRPSLATRNLEPISTSQFTVMEYAAAENSDIPTIDLSEPENQVISIEKAETLNSAIPEAPTLIATNPPSSEPKSGFDRRRYPRYHARFRIIIKNENLTFRTFSMDVSLGGLSLETAVPPGCVGSLCHILIGHPTSGENLSFSARMLSSRRESKYFSFTKSPPESISRLQKWLAACEPLKRTA